MRKTPERESDVEDYLTGRVKALLRYDSSTGAFTFRVARGRVAAGCVAGTLLTTGYIAIRIDGKRYLAHCLAWLVAHGAWPEGEIDHRNGDRADNTLDNLRDVPRSTNQQNQRKAQITNVNQLLGVSFVDTKTPRYRARIFFAGKEKHLGTFASAEEAHAAYVKAKREYHIGGTL